MKKNQANNYEAWNTKLPRTVHSQSDLVDVCLRHAILAPSTHNTQPWTIKKVNNQVILKPNWNKQLPYADPIQRGLFISLGCFICNYREVARYYKKDISYKISHSNSHDVSITLKILEPTIKKKLADSFAQNISTRFSDKKQYSKTPISNKHIAQLVQLSEKDPNLVILIKKDEICKLSKAYERSAYELSKTSGFRKEIAHWLRPNSTHKYDGMPGFVAGLGNLISHFGFAIAFFSPLALLQVKKDAFLLSNSTAVGVITHTETSQLAHIETGILYENIALKATSLGIHCTPMFGLVETNSGNQLLQSLTRRKNVHMFFRLGYSNNPVLHTPRKPL